MLLDSVEGRSDPPALRDLLAAHQTFQSLDDRAGRWRACAALSNWYIANQQHDKAVFFADEALRLAQQSGNPDRLFVSAIQLGQLKADRQLLAEVLPLARTDLERATIYVLLGWYDEAFAAYQASEYSKSPGSGDDPSAARPGQLAFVQYQLGKYYADESLVLSALNNYRSSANVFGIIDSLFLAAQLEQSPILARDYARRALLAAEQSGSARRSVVIRTWLAAHRTPQ